LVLFGLSRGFTNIATFVPYFIGRFKLLYHIFNLYFCFHKDDRTGDEKETKNNLYKKNIIFAIIELFIVFSMIQCITGTEKASYISNNYVNLYNIESNICSDPTNKEWINTIRGGDWNQTFGGSSYDEGYAVQQTNDGGYIITGATLSFGAGDWDVWLIKTDSNGNEEWNSTFGGSSYDRGYSIQQTNEGGYIIAGCTHSFGNGKFDVWLIKTDSNGSEEWNSTFGGISVDWGYSVVQAAEGSYIIAGYTDSYGAGGSDVWLIKTDSNGSEEWNSTFGGSCYDRGFSGQQTDDGGYIITGYTVSYNLDGTGCDVWLIKTDPNGNEEWNSTFGGTGIPNKFDMGYDVQQTNEGGYIISGDTEILYVSQSDVLLIKTDSSGNEVWTETFGGSNTDRGRSVQQTVEGGYIIVGWAVSFGEPDPDVWLIKTDMNGGEEWNAIYGFEVNSGDWGYAVWQTTDGGFIIAGATMSTGWMLNESYPLNKGEGTDVWLIKTYMGDNIPPIANFTFTPLHPCIGEIVSFSDSSIDLDGTIISWFWSFGDGNISYDQNPTHKYVNNGTYLVNLEIRDDDDLSDNISKLLLIGGNYIENLSFEWNFVSTPFNQTVNKTDIIFCYNDSFHIWQDACNDSVVLGFIYNWNRSSQNYLTTNVLYPGFGYWLYAYDTCSLWVYGVDFLDLDNYITDLKTDWNIIGIPFDDNVEKQNLTILYNGTIYSWENATTANNEEGEPLILSFIYGWNAGSQNYETCDVLLSGRSYWMYAYYDCMLTRDI